MAQSKDFPDSFFRVAVKGLCVRDGKLLMTEDHTLVPHGGKQGWELPGGGLDFGETYQEALAREVQEEMGLELTWMAPQPLYSWSMRREGTRNMEWFYALILTFPFEVQSLDITPSEECRSIRFFSKEELATLPNLSAQLEPLRTDFNPADFT